MDRRNFLIGMGVSAVGVTSAASIWQAVVDESEIHVSDQQRLLLSDLDAICDAVIPDTDTPGAKSVGVARWLVKAFEHELGHSSPQQLPRFLTMVNDGEAFSSWEKSQQVAYLTELDAQAFIHHSDAELPELWRTVKALIVMGYYTSKVGASEELRYSLVPGHFTPDAKIDPNSAQAWSSDWIAVKL